MEKKIGIWLDSEKAFLIALTNDGETVSRIESDVEHRLRFQGEGKTTHRIATLSGNPENKHEERKKHQLADYFERILKNIKDADQVFLFGPSQTKDWLGKEFKTNHLMESKLIGMANADLITERQMIARTREFFTDYEKNKKHH